MNDTLIEGIHEHVTPDVYHSLPYISRGDIMLFEEKPDAPLWYHWQKENGKDKRTAAKDFGQAFHTMMENPDLFDTRHVLSTFDSFRTNEAKAWRDDTLAAGKTIISKEERDALIGMGMSVRQHPAYARIMAGAIREATVVAKHSSTGLTRRARPDVLPRGNFIVDFKSTKDASKEEFGKQVWEMGWWRQAPHYLDCCNQVGEKKDEFLIFAVEKEPPYLCVVYPVPHELIEAGRKLNSATLYRIAHCVNANTWPGFPTSIENEFTIPPWAKRAIEEMEETV